MVSLFTGLLAMDSLSAVDSQVCEVQRFTISVHGHKSRDHPKHPATSELNVQKLRPF